MKKFIFVLVISIVAVFSSNGNKPDFHSVIPGQEEMFSLLKDWCDALIDHQLTHQSESLDGGIICPGCFIMHGRSPDAIYPLLYMASQTKDIQYIEAAKRLFHWGMKNVCYTDGSWCNEPNIGTWRGITVFGLIALLESIRDFGHLIDVETMRKWMKSAEEQAVYVSSFIKPGFGNINYSVTACYALALAGKMMEKPEYNERAASLVQEVMNFFTPNNHFLFGEGSLLLKSSPKGFACIDLGYNVEESLPNLLLYADLVGDDFVKEKVKQSMESHLEFMLPDGAWDNSWGVRNFKWSYWGSRTADGVISLCSVPVGTDPVYTEAGYRNVELLKKCTSQGLLFGGMHYLSAGYPACIHHTLFHAKGLAFALHKGFIKPTKKVELPREKEYGVKYFQDLDVWLVSFGDWRATITGYDADYTSGGNAHGGALSLLWNKKAGPLLASAMTEYSTVEYTNMQITRRIENYSSTLRIEYREKDKIYTNVSCKESVIVHSKETDGEKFTVHTELIDIEGKCPESGPIPVTIIYLFLKDKVAIGATVSDESKNRELSLAVPFISQGNEPCFPLGKGFYIEKPEVRVYLSSESVEIKTMPVEINQRAFNPTPGFEFIPFYIPFSKEVCITINV